MVIAAPIVGIIVWWRSSWALPQKTQTSLMGLLWLSCLFWGFLLMISSTYGNVPYTSLHIRDDMQDAGAALGLLLVVLGVYLGFTLGKPNRK